MRRDEMMNRKAFLNGLILVMLIATSVFPLTVGSETPAAGRAMYTTKNRFSDNSTEIIKDFLTTGSNSTTTLTIPKNALLKSATVQIRGELFEDEGNVTNETTADFLSGSLINLTAYNGTLLLKPFLAQTTYATQTSPVSVAVGDVNCDGRNDWVVANSDSNTISVLAQNTATGTMNAQTTYAVGNGPQSVAIGDLNRDGLPDVAVACLGGNSLCVLLQNNAGTLDAALSFASGSGARSVALGDFNVDNRRDAVVANSNANTISLFLQNDTGGLELAGTFPTGTNPWSVAAGDINLDGQDEAVVACKGDSTVYLFQQDPTLGFVANGSVVAGGTPVSVTIGDIDRDGRNDVVVAEQSTGTVGVMNQSSNGSINPRVGYPVGNSPYCVAVGDVSYDGRDDIVVSNSGATSVSILVQKPDNTLAPAEDYTVGNQPCGVAIGDANFDGKKDIVVTNKADNTAGTLLLRPSLRSRMNAGVAYNVGQAPIGVATGDLNSDGLEDLLSGNAGASSLGVLLQNKAGTMNAQVSYAFGDPLGVAVCDIDRDGRDDLVWADQPGNAIGVSFQTPSGNFANGATLYPTYVAGGMPYIVACGDVNSDGWPDILASEIATAGVEPEVFVVLLQNASNNHTFDQMYNMSCGDTVRGVAIGDINTDGVNEVVAAIPALIGPYIQVYTQFPNGTLDSTPTTYTTDAGAHGVKIADLNADGRNDVVVSNWQGNNVNVFTQTSTGALNNKAAYAVASNGVDVAIGDYDSDGRNDLAVTHYAGSNSASVLNQTSEGTFAPYVGYNTGNQPAYITSGDFNGDGKTDFAVANQLGNTVSVFTQNFNAEMNGTYQAAYRQLPYDIFEATPFWNITTYMVNQTAKVEITNNGGTTWTTATNGMAISFFDAGSKIGFRVKVTSPALNTTPLFENITIHYRMRSYPVNPSLDIGGMGYIWNRTGPFGLDAQPATIDFAERLNATVQESAPDTDGNVNVTFSISSASLGRLRLSNLTVVYDLAPQAPVLLSYMNGDFTYVTMPQFKMTARDNDTDQLRFKIEISQNNFTTKRMYDQLVSTDHWTKVYYAPGETATYQVSDYDKFTADGLYQWRAFVYDGTIWSGPSDVGSFRLDTKAPVSNVTLLPSYQNSTKFTVLWTGIDPEPGSGLNISMTFDIQFKQSDNAPWIDWLLGTNATFAEFTGEQGKTYFFQVRARDATGNVGNYKMGQGDTFTKVDTTAPVGTVSDDGEISGDHTKLHAVFNFIDSETDVIRYEYWVGTAPGEGSNDTKGPIITESRDVTVTGLTLLNGSRYYFTVRAQNGAGSWSRPMSSDGISIKLKTPVPGIAYPNEAQQSTDIEIFTRSTDPNSVGLEDGDLEYRSAPYANRAIGDWSAWKELGGSDWGDGKPNSDAILFNGTPGMVYKFRYRVRDHANTTSEWTDLQNITRINRAPTPAIFRATNAIAGNKVTFMANGSSDADGDAMKFSWDFGDGKWDYGTEVRHAFSGAKKYRVTLYADDGIENVTLSLDVTVQAKATKIEMGGLLFPLIIVAVVGAVGALYFIMTRKKKNEEPLPPTPLAPATAEHKMPTAVSETPAPPGLPLTKEEVEVQILAAKESVDELKLDSIDPSRAVKMLALAQSFFADGNIETASQYAKKTVKLSKDMKDRKESEVDEDTARKFINDTQKQLEVAENAGLKLKEAKKMMGLAISFLAEGNYVTGMQYSKKVRKILDETMAREGIKAPSRTGDAQDGPAATIQDVESVLNSAMAMLVELRKAGEDVAQMEEETDMARTVLDDGEVQVAMEHAVIARDIGRALREKGKPVTAAEWKELAQGTKARILDAKEIGQRTIQPEKLLKLAESFAVSGNREIANQYLAKAGKLLDDMDARARVEAAEGEAAASGARPAAAPSGSTATPEEGVCPGCNEAVEPDWLICPSCKTKLKEAPVNAAADAEPAKESGPAGTSGTTETAGSAPDTQAITAPDAQASPAPATANTEGATPKKCPTCGMDVQSDWKICPACDVKLE